MELVERTIVSLRSAAACNQLCFCAVPCGRALQAKNGWNGAPVLDSFDYFVFVASERRIAASMSATIIWNAALMVSGD